MMIQIANSHRRILQLNWWHCTERRIVRMLGIVIWVDNGRQDKGASKMPQSSTPTF
jgi:hypothetical protein